MAGRAAHCRRTDGARRASVDRRRKPQRKHRPYAYRCRTADWGAPQIGLGRRRIGAGLVGKGERNEIEQEPASLAYVASAESSLEGRDIDISVSPKDIRTSPYDLCAVPATATSGGRRGSPRNSSSSGTEASAINI